MRSRIYIQWKTITLLVNSSVSWNGNKKLSWNRNNVLNCTNFLNIQLSRKSGKSIKSMKEFNLRWFWKEFSPHECEKAEQSFDWNLMFTSVYMHLKCKTLNEPRAYISLNFPFLMSFHQIDVEQVLHLADSSYYSCMSRVGKRKLFILFYDEMWMN